MSTSYCVRENPVASSCERISIAAEETFDGNAYDRIRRILHSRLGQHRAWPDSDDRIICEVDILPSQTRNVSGIIEDPSLGPRSFSQNDILADLERFALTLHPNSYLGSNSGQYFSGIPNFSTIQKGASVQLEIHTWCSLSDVPPTLLGRLVAHFGAVTCQIELGHRGLQVQEDQQSEKKI
jgi:hypothetical protein